MPQLDIEIIFARLEIAIRTNDKDFIIECLEELTLQDGVDNRLLSYVYLAKSLCHITNHGKEKYLQSYRDAMMSISIRNSDKGQQMLEIVKDKIMESPRMKCI